MKPPSSLHWTRTDGTDGRHRLSRSSKLSKLSGVWQSCVCGGSGRGRRQASRRALRGRGHAGALAARDERRLSTAGGHEAPPHRTLLTRLGIRKPSVSGLAPHPRAARTFSLDDLLKPPPGRKDWSDVFLGPRPARSATDDLSSLVSCSLRPHTLLHGPFLCITR